MPKQRANNGLPKECRLKSPADYREVYGSEYWGNTRLFSFNVIPAENSALGVTVSKKVSNLAVKRNLIKRQIKEFYRIHQAQLPNTKIVITAKPLSGSQTRAKRREDLNELWHKALKWRRWYEHNNAAKK